MTAAAASVPPAETEWFPHLELSLIYESLQHLQAQASAGGELLEDSWGNISAVLLRQGRAGRLRDAVRKAPGMGHSPLLRHDAALWCSHHLMASP